MTCTPNLPWTHTPTSCTLPTHPAGTHPGSPHRRPAAAPLPPRRTPPPPPRSCAAPAPSVAGPCAGHVKKGCIQGSAGDARKCSQDIQEAQALRHFCSHPPTAPSSTLDRQPYPTPDPQATNRSPPTTPPPSLSHLSAASMPPTISATASSSRRSSASESSICCSRLGACPGLSSASSPAAAGGVVREPPEPSGRRQDCRAQQVAAGGSGLLPRRMRASWRATRQSLPLPLLPLMLFS